MDKFDIISCLDGNWSLSSKLVFELFMFTWMFPSPVGHFASCVVMHDSLAWRTAAQSSSADSRGIFPSHTPYSIPPYHLNPKWSACCGCWLLRIHACEQEKAVRGKTYRQDIAGYTGGYQRVSRGKPVGGIQSHYPKYNDNVFQAFSVPGTSFSGRNFGSVFSRG